MEAPDGCKNSELPNETNSPVVIASGNKVLDETDFATADGVFVFTRTYSKQSTGNGFGTHWMHPFAYTLTGTQRPGYGMCPPGYPPYGEPCPLGNRFTHILAHRPDGVSYRYTWNSSTLRYEDSRPESTTWIEEDEVWTDSVGGYDISTGAFRLRREDGGIEAYSGNGRILSLRDIRDVGYTFTYGLMGNGPLQTVTHTSGRQISLTFASGRFTSVTAPGGKVYTYGYDGLRLTSVTYPDSLGVKTYHYENASQPNALTGYSIDGVRKTRYAYKADGRVDWSGREGAVERDTFAYGTDFTDVTNALGYTTRYNFTNVGGIKRVSSVSRPASTACAGGTAATEYGTNTYVAREVDFLGHRTFNTWNNRGQLQEKRSGVGPAPGNSTANQYRVTYGWDTARNLMTRESHYGKSGSIQSEVLYTYHPDLPATHGRLLQKVERCAPTCASGTKRTTTYTYVIRANRMIQTVTVDGPLAGTGDAVTYQYDTAGNLTSVTNGVGHVTTWSEFNGLGQPGRMVDANGLSTRYTWDAKGRNVTTTVQPTGGDQIWSNVWRSDDQLASTQDPTGLVTTFVYDGIGRRTEVRMQSAQQAGATDRIVLDYNALSQVTRRRAGYSGTPDGALMTTLDQYYEYDTAGYLKRSIGNNGQQRIYDYNGNGQIAGWVDAAGYGETYLYNSRGQLSLQVDALSGNTTMGYDVLGRLSSVTDPRGKVTSYVYNGFGDLLTQVSPDSGTTSLTYNAEGQLATVTRNDGSQLAYQYDALGRVYYIGNAQVRRGYSYDWCENGVGRLCGYETADTANILTLTHHGYMQQGQLRVRRDLNYTIGSDDWTVYSYDPAGRIAGIAYPSGTSVGYGYAHGRLSVIQATIAGTTHNVATGMIHQPFGQLARMNYGNGVIKERAYDLDGRMTITHDHGFVGHTLHYNNRDQIASIHNWARPYENVDYAYDPLGRLSHIANGHHGSQNLYYDANGNRTQHDWWVPESGYMAVVPYAVDPNSNRAHDQHIAYAYDARGNRLSQSVFGTTATYAYDAFNHLQNVSRDAAVAYPSPGAQYTQHYPAGTTTYTTNAIDQRVAKSGPLGSSRSIYAGQTQLLAEVNVGAWSDYIWMGNEPIAMVRNNQLYYFHNDHLGRPEIITNSARQHVWHASNFAFDRHVTYSSIGHVNLGFPGQYFDAETGFWHNGFRTYDSRLGRYLQSDPIGLAGGLNTYAYAHGNPVSRVDPLGLDDFNLIPTNEPMHGWVNNYQDGQNILSIAVHGMPGRFLVNGQLITGQQLFDHLNKNPAFREQLKRADVIQLNSCRVGKTDASGYNAASDFANAAGKPTYAPEVWSWRRPDGSFFLGGAIGGQSVNGWDFSHHGNLVFLPGGGP
ncbi:RHS repeat-associated core domain-containing protein [Luteimonas aestuarii]|nr:RHS repeat-associated core domain-containing protein [Luteimonas aestuarii]